MNKFALVPLIVLLAFKIKEKNAPNLFRMVQKEYKTPVENGTIVLIYNGVCRGGLCGSQLNKYLIKNIPISTKDSIYFLVLNDDKNLIDTLHLYQKGRVIYTKSNTLNKYSIYEQESTAVRIQNNKITRSTKIYRGVRFNHWSF